METVYIETEVNKKQLIIDVLSNDLNNCYEKMIKVNRKDLEKQFKDCKKTIKELDILVASGMFTLESLRSLLLCNVCFRAILRDEKIKIVSQPGDVVI